MNEKKRREVEHLKEVFKCARKKQGRTRRIIQNLEGELIEREEDERPDFILKVKQNSKHDKGKIIGIEHFIVDQYAFQNKKGEMESASKRGVGRVNKIREKYGNLEEASEQQMDAAFADFVKVVCENCEFSLLSGYHSLIDSFEYAIKVHLEKVPEYWKTIEACSLKNKENCSLGFFIEVLSDCSSLFLVADDKVNQCQKGQLPFFIEIAERLQTLYAKGVQYVIIAMREPLTEKLVDVVVLSTKDIQTEFRKQKIKTYYYAATDRLLKEHYSKLKNLKVSSEISKGNDQYHIKYLVEGNMLNQEIIEKLVNNAFYCAYWAKAHGQNYAADSIVQVMMEAMAPYIVKWEEGKGEDAWMFTPHYQFVSPAQKQKVLTEVQIVMRKYGLDESKVENI